jgi:hypothetical protein
VLKNSLCKRRCENDSFRGSRIENLGATHVGTSPETDPAELKGDFFSSLLRIQYRGDMHRIRYVETVFITQNFSYS